MHLPTWFNIKNQILKYVCMNYNLFSLRWVWRVDDLVLKILTLLAHFSVYFSHGENLAWLCLLILTACDVLIFFFWKGTKEMTEWLGVLATLAEDLALVPRTHIKWLPTVCDSSSLGSTVLFWPQGLLHCCGAPKHLLHTDEYIFKVFEENTMIFETFKIHMKFSVENNNILT